VTHPAVKDQAREYADEPLLAPVLTGYRRVEYFIGVALWFAALVYFWTWWLRPEHHFSAFGTVFATWVLAWVTLIPAYFLMVFACAVRPSGPLRLPTGSRVAMVVTKAPSEPFSVVAETLLAMLAQNVPHDTWLADEDPSFETLQWCRRYGVSVSTRKGRADYHRTTWPRRTRCKEGNLAFFYDHYGYERYDFVVQLDADHVPEPGYLREMLRPFADPGVGYVSAPSICDRNAAESWSARGRLHAEANFHGSLQAGYSGAFAPMCIGSHYAVRTAALKEIGGLGPELAEDHSTTLMMNAYDWRGVHALDAIAHGDGPRTFADLATQEFQWSRSVVMILLQYSSNLIPRSSFSSCSRNSGIRCSRSQARCCSRCRR
jgi:cellulose synthase/poly-beta-1,6-N-acetylglucosamine synthase-like glycosyltransferase